jgi:UDP-N-acetyl-D-glucosamine dehydrogenase
MESVSVIGQGYVGLPLSIESAKVGFKVTGIDINSQLVNELNQGISRISDISNEEIRKVLASGNYIATTDYSFIRDSEIIAICVPTPLNDHGKPDLSFLINAVKNVARNMSNNSLIIVESTIEPGMTRNLVKPLLQDNSKNSKIKFDLAFSPERIDPSNQIWNIKNTVKLISGLTPSALNRTRNYYSKFISEIHECNSLEIAESAKLLENTFRLINISFVNEFSQFCNKMNIEVNDVISAAATKPYGFMSFYPSIGIGGHCIPVDPMYLANKANEIGAELKTITVANKINIKNPEYFVHRAEEKIGDLKDKSILVVGIAYKSNVADVRETPVRFLIEELRKKNAKVFWHDELVGSWRGEKTVPLEDTHDLVIIATPHDYMDLTQIVHTPILNTRNSL